MWLICTPGKAKELSFLDNGCIRRLLAVAIGIALAVVLVRWIDWSLT